MITGFGNNTSSALASDITASQTSFRVVPETGEKFAKLLTPVNSNSDSPHGVYAKLTLTDSQQTVFEICHLTGVAYDTLTVIRGQEGTQARGWALNDVVGNFATSGSEQSFVQIEQLQAGDYTSATAAGTPNALSISLPSTFFNNNSKDWMLKTPLTITPIAANSGASTLQLILGGRVLDTLPLYKGNRLPLEAGDLIAGLPVQCLLDESKSFFSVLNPTSAYRDQINFIYPVGIVTWFAQNKDPNKLFPATSWKYIGEDRTIRLASVNGSDVMTTGGSDSVTLATGNMPAHAHTFSGNTTAFDYGTRGTSGVGDHGHNAWTDGQGAHSHGTGLRMPPNQDGTVLYGTRPCADGNAAWSKGNSHQPNDSATSTDGAHAHNVGIGGSGAHNHTIGIGAHSHSMSGATANTGSTVPFQVTNQFIKLMGWYRSA